MAEIWQKVSGIYHFRSRFFEKEVYFERSSGGTVLARELRECYECYCKVEIYVAIKRRISILGVLAFLVCGPKHGKRNNHEEQDKKIVSGDFDHFLSQYILLSS